VLEVKSEIDSVVLVKEHEVVPRVLNSAKKKTPINGVANNFFIRYPSS